MQSYNIISRSDTEYIKPIVAAPKGEGISLCLDGRFINQKLKVDREVPQGIEEIFKRCTAKKYISQLDLRSSFHQIKLAEESRKYTGFQINGRVYHYNVVCFGLACATSALLRALEKILKDVLEFTLNFVDDLSVLSHTFIDHIYHLEKIFKILIENNITINFDKCNFCKKEIRFLGFILTKDGLKQDPEKI